MIILIALGFFGIFVVFLWKFIFKPQKRVLKFLATRSPICIIAGPNGAGKTWLATQIASHRLDMGRKLLSTSRLTDPTAIPDQYGKRPDHPLFERWWHINQLLDWENLSYDVLADEAVLQGLDAREALSMPAEYRKALQQLRKVDLSFTATVPSIHFVDKTLRTMAQHYVEVRGYASKKVPGKLWTQKRLFLVTVYDAKEFSQWTDHARDSAKPIFRCWIWRPGKVADRLYDTYESVLPIAGLEEMGKCSRCHGKPVRKTCKCEDGPQLPHQRQATVSAEEDVAA